MAMKNRKKEDDSEDAEGEFLLSLFFFFFFSFIHHHFFFSDVRMQPGFFFLVRIVETVGHYRFVFELKIEEKE